MLIRPLVSILVPFYNVEQYIERCARSIFEQTYDNLEIIFVDDCSSDKSNQILENVLSRYSQRTDQVKIVHHSKNRGLPAARNSLIEHTSGDYVFFVDSDDSVERNAVELLVKRQQETDADIVTARAYFHLPDRTVEYPDGGWQVVNKNTAIKKLLHQDLSHSLWRRLVRTSLFRENDLRWREGVNMDVDFQVVPRMVYYAKKIDGLDAFIYHYYRDNEGSLMTRCHNSYQLQDYKLESIKGIIHFFEERDQECYGISCEYLVKSLYSILDIAAEQKDKERFNSTIEKLGQYRQHWSAIKWNHSLLWLIEHNYYSYLFFSPIMDITRKLYHIIKRG